MKHGTAYAYDKGCHCADCRAAKMRKKREWRERARADGRPAYSHDLEATRARQETYRGTCQECGSSTTGSNGKTSAPPLCNACASAKTGLAQRGTGAVGRAVLDLLAKDEMRAMDIAAAVGITKYHAGNILHRLVQYGLVERVRRGVYRAKAVA